MIFIIIGICSVVYIASVFIVRNTLILNIIGANKLGRIDLLLKKFPIWNTFLIVGWIVYCIFYYSKQNFIKFKRWFINEK